MGLTAIPRVSPRRRAPTSLQMVVEQYARGERDLDGLERGVEWLLRHGLSETFQPIAARWPPKDPAALPDCADPRLGSL